MCLARLTLTILVALHGGLRDHRVNFVVKQECRSVGREYGSVDDEQQNDPVPDCLEWRVVQNGPFVLVGLHSLEVESGHQALRRRASVEFEF